MIKALISLFKGKKKKTIGEYKGLSDFFLHATAEQKKAVITKAAQRANEDQLRTFKEAELKLKTH